VQARPVPAWLNDHGSVELAGITAREMALGSALRSLIDLRLVLPEGEVHTGAYVAAEGVQVDAASDTAVHVVRARDTGHVHLLRPPAAQIHREPAEGGTSAPLSHSWGHRAIWFVAILLVMAACGGGASGSPAALALGQQAVVDHTQLNGTSPGPKTSLGITALAVRTGTIAELEAGGFQLTADQRSMTPYYVDVRFENKGSQTIDRQLDVSLEDQDGNLITSVTIFDLGGQTFATCPDNATGQLAPGDAFETCDLFLVNQGRKPTKVSFLPYDPAKETNFVYWSVGGS
jgi:hypothetical protein